MDTKVLFAINGSLINEDINTNFSTPIVYKRLVSNKVSYWNQMIVYIGANSLISILGMVANLINWIVFIRQGLLSDNCTVTLFVLSVSDFFSVLTLLWLAICFVLVHIQPPYLPFNPHDMLYIAGGRFHLMFVQSTGWITVYLAFVRCMCVVFPFKVGRMFTPKKTAASVTFIFAAVIIFGYGPYFIVENFVWQKLPNSNRSILVYRGNQKLWRIVYASTFINPFVAKPGAILFVFFFTLTTVIHVNTSRKWRELTTKRGQKAGKETKLADSKIGNEENDRKDTVVVGREKRLVKKIWVICVIFLACMTPDLILFIVESVDKRIDPRKQFSNLFFFMYSFSFFLEGVNSTVNIFVYYNMSSKYRLEFNRLFGIKQEKK